MSKLLSDYRGIFLWIILSACGCCFLNSQELSFALAQMLKSSGILVIAAQEYRQELKQWPKSLNDLKSFYADQRDQLNRLGVDWTVYEDCSFEEKENALLIHMLLRYSRDENSPKNCSTGMNINVEERAKGARVVLADWLTEYDSDIMENRKPSGTKTPLE